MRILFIDDQEERVEVARSFFYRNLGDTFTWLQDVPENFQDYDLISFDNDLGEDKEVVSILRRRLFDGNLDLDSKAVVVHSMNNVANSRIASICEAAGARVRIIPFHVMVP